MWYDGSWILYGLEGDEEELGRVQVKGCGGGWRGKISRLVMLREWVVIRKQNGRRCSLETINCRPQTASDWPYSILATSEQRPLIHSSNP